MFEGYGENGVSIYAALEVGHLLPPCSRLGTHLPVEHSTYSSSVTPSLFIGYVLVQNQPSDLKVLRFTFHPL
jgi:hypothetical protein